MTNVFGRKQPYGRAAPGKPATDRTHNEPVGPIIIFTVLAGMPVVSIGKQESGGGQQQEHR